MLAMLSQYNNNFISESTKCEIEKEIDALLNSSYQKVKLLLKEKKKEHLLLADALLKYETLDLEEIKLLMEWKPKTLTALKKGEIH